MPAEAVHLSALEDTLLKATPPVRRATSASPLREAARLGAIFVDLPYFERFPLAVLRYALRRPQADSRWGDIFHRRAPIALCCALAESGARLQRAAATQEAGELLIALALGYVSHAAVDTALHPLINRLAAARAAALHDVAARQHLEVEKFQSILFHRHRLGFDFMGTDHLRRHIAVHVAPIVRPGPAAQAVQSALSTALGETPGPERLDNWASGYAAYGRLISSRIGKTIAPAAAQERERQEVFDAVDFLGRYAKAVQRSAIFVAALWDYLDDGRFDESARAAFQRAVPEGTLDPGPESPV